MRVHPALNIACFALVMAVLCSSCRITRRLAPGEYLLKKNVFSGLPDNIERSDVESYLKQKTNRRVLGLRLHLRLFNTFDKKKLDAIKLERDKKIDEENIQLAARRKKLKSKDKLTFKEWLIGLGESPVVHDSILALRSAKQVNLFLNNKGYFNNIVKDSVVRHKRELTVYYLIKTRPPYTIKEVSYQADDTGLAPLVMNDSENSLISKGSNYDVDVLQKERERMTKIIRNSGYYDFSKEFIYFKVDSSLKSNQINIMVGVKKFFAPASPGSDSLVETNHVRYTINEIILQPDYRVIATNNAVSSFDTIRQNGINIIYHNELEYKPKVLTEAVMIHPGEAFNAEAAEITYRRFSDLRAFKFINISFKRAIGATDKLDCYIYLTPVLKQSFTTEIEGTNTQGNLGVAGSLVYQNKNFFKGAEVVELRLKGAVEAQKLSDDNTANNGLPSTVIPFNTIQFGPEASINLPRAFLPFSIFKFSRNADPKTTFTAGMNYQQRPDYTRSIFNLSYSLSYKESATKRHTFFLPDFSFVKVFLSKGFQAQLDQSNDVLAIYRFSDHFSAPARWIYSYTNQDIRKKSNYVYFKSNAEISGILAQGLFDLFDPGSKDPVDGSYKIDKIRFAEYWRADIEARYYQPINDFSKLVFRAFLGVGIPFLNSVELPLERSFVGGGANGLRAWRARTLGPGAYQPLPGTIYQQLGDIQAEGNVEYRFKVFKSLNGALFMDMGNIWLHKTDKDRPESEFDAGRFYSELAVNTGIGTRFDFSFFIIRLDLGFKIRDPQFATDKRWVVGHFFDDLWRDDYFKRTGITYEFVNWNLGIGYPF